VNSELVGGGSKNDFEILDQKPRSH